MATRSSPSVTEAVDAYVASLVARGYAVRTVAAYREILNRLAKHVGGKQVGRVTPADAEAFISDLAAGVNGRTNGQAAIYSQACRLRSFFRWCHRRGWIAHANHLEDIRYRPTEKRDYLRLSAAELLRMLDRADNARDRALLAMGMNTGLRCSEIISIKIRDLDLDRFEFYARIHKSRTSDRMPITADLDAELRRWLTWYAGQLDAPLHGEFYLFPAWTSPLFVGRDREANRPIRLGQQLRPNNPVSKAERVVQRALMNIGYPSDLVRFEGFHTLRRSVARLYFDSIVREGGYTDALRATMALLHHKNAATTERYLGLDAEKSARDARMKGLPFITGMVDGSNVTVLREAGSGGTGGSRVLR